MSERRIVVMGRVLGPFGVQGWIKVKPLSEAPETLLDYRQWWLTSGKDRDDWHEMRVAAARAHNDTLVAQIEGIATREQALIRRGALIGLERSALAKLADGEFYWSDLMGLAVVNRVGMALGKVVDMVDAGVHPVLRVIAEGGNEAEKVEQGGIERLIPMVPAYIDSVDLEGGRINVDWQADY